MTFPLLGEKYSTTKECGAASKVKMAVDDGDAHMSLCKECFRRFMGRVKKPEEWYGWFDCDYPVGSRVKYSGWWSEMNKKEVAAAAAATAAATAKEQEEQEEEQDEEEEQEDEAEPSAEELLLKKIAELEGWIRGNMKKVKVTEMAKVHKGLMEARAQLKIIRKN